VPAAAVLAALCVFAEGAARPLYALQDASPPSEFQAGLTALQAKDFEGALRHFTVAEEAAPADARVHNFRAIALAALGRRGEASAEFENAIRFDAELEDAYRGLGFLEWTEHRPNEAISHLERAAALAPGDSFAHYYLGRVLLDQGESLRALRELDLSRDLWPNDGGFFIQIASASLSLERRADAQKVLERASDLPLTPRQTAQVASLFAVAQDARAAVALLQKFCVGLKPNPPDWARFDLALAHLLAGEYEPAGAAAREYLDSIPADARKTQGTGEAWSIIGIAAARRGDSAGSLEALNRAVELSPGREESWLNLTLELMSLARASEAVSAAKKGLAAIPKSYALRLRLGAASLAAGHYEDAEQQFRELVNAGDPLPLSYVGLAQVLLRNGRAEEAASELLAARQKVGDDFLLDYFCGLALDRAGKLAEALPAYEQAVARNPKSVEARLGIAKTELALNRVTESIAQLKEVLLLDPSNVQAARLLSRAYRRAGDAANASKYAGIAGTEGEPQPDRTLLGDFIAPDWAIPAEDADAL
jgi:tetratricopeptide (TPR) repeat protein